MYINPYVNIKKENGQWLRANFHTHAGTGEGTCGALEINEVIKYYKVAGYSVLTISNHDLFSDVSEIEKEHDMVLINGFEYSQEKHMLCIGGDKLVLDRHQNTINECNNQGGFVVLCHPNWIHKEYWPWKDIDDLHGYLGIEIMNSVIFRLSGSALATDTWDYLLSQGKLVWGFGNDDFHRWYDMAKSWNMIYAGMNRMDVMESIRSGRFYVSTGLLLNEFDFQQGSIKLTACAKDNYINNYKYIFIGKDGQILKEQTGVSGEYDMNGSELYVRVHVISEHGAMLWTQPLYDDSRFIRP